VKTARLPLIQPVAVVEETAAGNDLGDFRRKYPVPTKTLVRDGAVSRVPARQTLPAAVFEYGRHTRPANSRARD